MTYGTFRAQDGQPFPSPQRVRADFEAMARAGVNALRTYVPPPPWLLDLAQEQGLRVMVGLAWAQHVAFLEEPAMATEIATRLGEDVRRCGSHPAILCYAIGNEIPAPIVRWHGKRDVERFLERLYWEAKDADPEGLVTYVNFPSTEYLELPYFDVAAFNVFLEDERTFEAYLARLQNLTGDRPLLITEAGIDSRRHGKEAQARALEWQVRHAFGTGAAGVFVFSWTDEWHRGGHDVTDWEFGLVDCERRPKPSLDSIQRAFSRAPFAAEGPWAPVSVVVCTHNGVATLGECLERLASVTYPDFEVIVVDDGSTDGSAQVAEAHGARVVRTEHRGLSHARNAGIAAASGEIVAFLDDDAYPDPDWLHYIAAALRSDGHAGVGGPNLPPEDDGLVADCVAAAPGGPIHVLISDREAEHVPGCNMAFRKAALEEIGGFDERFRVAGDDVDVCWRLQESGRTLGFSAGAVVMHRRRDSVRRYLRQQYGYGKAEALLERKWPDRYSRAGASRWSGRIYDQPATASAKRPMIRYGTWGGGLFQSVYDPAPGILSGVLVAPELLLMLAALGVVGALGLLWMPLLGALPLFVLGLGAVLWHAVGNGWRAHPPVPDRPRLETFRRRALTATLFLLQPFARLAGRLRNGLSPWRRRLRPGAAWPRPRAFQSWRETWREPHAWIQVLQDAIAARGGFVRSGGPFDRWDLEVRAGSMGSVRLQTVVEEHGHGRQLVRTRAWPRVSAAAVIVAVGLALLFAYAWRDGQLGFQVSIAVLLLLLIALAIEGTGTAMSIVAAELEAIDEDSAADPAAGDFAPDPAPGPEPQPALARRPSWDGARPAEEQAVLHKSVPMSDGRQVGR